MRDSQKGMRVFKLLSAVFKIAVASLITGVVLSALDVSAAEVLSELGLTPEQVLGYVERGVVWALPNIVLGSMVIVPIWFVIYLLRPPRG